MESYITSTTDYLPLLSEFELHGDRNYSNIYEPNYQKQYDYYKAGNSKDYYRHNSTGNIANVWNRSINPVWDVSFCYSYIDRPYTDDANNSKAISPCFAV